MAAQYVLIILVFSNATSYQKYWYCGTPSPRIRAGLGLFVTGTSCVLFMSFARLGISLRYRQIVCFACWTKCWIWLAFILSAVICADCAQRGELLLTTFEVNPVIKCNLE
jgi:hypothetical protein